MELPKKQLASGDISVWQEGTHAIIHHKAGLTIDLTQEEHFDLLEWLGILHEQIQDVARLQEFIETQYPKRETLGSNDKYLLDYHIRHLEYRWHIKTVIGEDGSIQFQEEVPV